MQLWLVTQSIRSSYETFDSAVVAAETEAAAREVPVGDTGDEGSWASPEHVTATLIGCAVEGTKAGAIICASYNAG